MTYNINFLAKRKIEISDALASLCPEIPWSVGDTYESIKFQTDDEIPSEQEINAEIERLQAIADSYEYQRLRKQEYPSFEDQFDILYHGGYDAWKEEIDKVKKKYPKPE